MRRSQPNAPSRTLRPSVLRWLVSECVRYYNQGRPHQSLQHLPPEAPDVYPGEGKIVAHPVLSGFINDYSRQAA